MISVESDKISRLFRISVILIEVNSLPYFYFRFFMTERDLFICPTTPNSIHLLPVLDWIWRGIIRGVQEIQSA